MTMTVHDFSDDTTLTDRMVRFGAELYRGDDNWIAPFQSSLREQLSPSYRFCRKPGNDRMNFVAMDGGKTVGHAAAMVNADLRETDGAVGTVGFFECVDHYAVAEKLFTAAIDWLRRVHGITRVWGPMNFDIWHDYRMMTRGFDRPVFYGEPYNKPYYPGFFERYGWRPKRNWESVEVIGDAIEQLTTWGTPRYQDFVANGYRFDKFDNARFDSELTRLYGALTESFSGFFGFTPITIDEFVAMFSKLKYALDPRLFTFVTDPRGELAGFAGAFLDLSAAVRAMRGQTSICARLRFIMRRRRVDRLVFYIIGLSAREAARQTGLGSAAVCHVTQSLHTLGYRSIVAALMPQDGRSRGLVGGRDAMPAQREYTLYEIEI